MSEIDPSIARGAAGNSFTRLLAAVILAFAIGLGVTSLVVPPKAEAFNIYMSSESYNPGRIFEWGNWLPAEQFWSYNGTVCYCMQHGRRFNYDTWMENRWGSTNGSYVLLLQGYPNTNVINGSWWTDNDARYITQAAIWCVNGTVNVDSLSSDTELGWSMIAAIRNLVWNYNYYNGGGQNLGWSGNDGRKINGYQTPNRSDCLTFGPFNMTTTISTTSGAAYDGTADDLAGSYWSDSNGNWLGWGGSNRFNNPFYLTIPKSSLAGRSSASTYVTIHMWTPNIDLCCWGVGPQWQDMQEVWIAGTYQHWSTAYLDWANIEYRIVNPEMENAAKPNIRNSDLVSWKTAEAIGSKYVTRSTFIVSNATPDDTATATSGGTAYSCAQWYTDQGATNRWRNGNSQVNGDMVLYGKWIQAKTSLSNKPAFAEPPLAVGDRLIYTLKYTNLNDKPEAVTLHNKVPANTSLIEGTQTTTINN